MACTMMTSSVSAGAPAGLDVSAGFAVPGQQVHIDSPVSVYWLDWGQYDACDRPIGAHHISSEDALVRQCYWGCIPYGESMLA